MRRHTSSGDRKQPRDAEAALTHSMVGLAGQYGRYGYRRVHALLQAQGWQVSHGRVMRWWRREGLKVPAKQPNRGRLWLNDGSCTRLRPRYQNHVWWWDWRPPSATGTGITCASPRPAAASTRQWPRLDQPRSATTGVRLRPRSDGRRGFLHEPTVIGIDSVHQGDFNGVIRIAGVAQHATLAE